MTDESPDAAPAAPNAAPLPQLSAIQARILGCLIEKAAITPDVYPLTVNATVAACNQKTSREPLMNLELGEVGHALREMTDKGLAKLDPFAQRAARYSHCFDSIYGVTPRQRAALCVLLLRGAQTLSEIYTRSERLTDFPALDDVRDTLERLIERQPALVVRIPRSAGRREDRYMHLLCGPVDADAFIDAAAPTSNHAAANNDVLERIEKLEAEVAQLRELVAQLSAPRA